MPVPGENLVQLLMQQAEGAARVAATYPEGGGWRDITWNGILDEVKVVSEALITLGVAPGDRVALFAGTSLRWLVCDLAVSAARAVSVPIYASNTPDECRFILDNSGAVVLFVDHDEAEGKQPGRRSRIRPQLSALPSLRHVILFQGVTAGSKELAWDELLRRGAEGRAKNPGGFLERVGETRSGDLCCFIYTSGTTGDPKGVMLTHGNWVFEAHQTGTVGLMEGTDTVMLFLPLAHSFAQVIKAAWLGLGFRLVFAESNDKLIANLLETRPTILPSVPRVFEKIYNGVVGNGMSTPGVKGQLFRWAMALFDESVEARTRGEEFHSLSFALAKRLVFSKVRKALDEKLGGKLRLFISGGAPLSLKIACFFDMLGYIVLEGYGLTETSAASTVNRPTRRKLGTVGLGLPGVELKIAADGEILIRGPHVMQGYYQNPSATAEVLEANGWFHSGDIGELDAQGFLKITDRKKDIIVTAGGKNIAPQNLENKLKGHPVVSQAMVHGDKRKYLSVLITVAEDNAAKLLREAGVSQVAAYADYAKHPVILAAVQKAVDSVNASEPPHGTLKRFAVMDHDFTQESGELTPTLKVKRKSCTLNHKRLLDSLYDEGFVD